MNKLALIIAILVLILVISSEIVLFIKSQYHGLDPKFCKCDKLIDETKGRVFKGYNVTSNDLNYVGVILKQIERDPRRIRKYRSIGGATLLNTRFALTTPYIFYYYFYINTTTRMEDEFQNNTFYMTLGLDHNLLKTYNNRNQTKKIKEIHHHPNFDIHMKKRLDYRTIYSIEYNIIAILEMEEPFEISKNTNIFAACLIEDNIIEYSNRLIFAGYGLNKNLESKEVIVNNRIEDNYDNILDEVNNFDLKNTTDNLKNTEIDNIYKEGELVFISDNSESPYLNYATDFYQKKCIKNNFMLCVLSNTTFIYTSEGGSSILYELKDKLFVTGLFVFSNYSHPLMYFIRVYPHLNWINEVLNYERCYSNGQNFVFNLVYFGIFCLFFISTCFIGLIILNIITNNFSTKNLDSKYFYLKFKSKPMKK